jgi:hypothetical protein
MDVELPPNAGIFSRAILKNSLPRPFLEDLLVRAHKAIRLELKERRAGMEYEADNEIRGREMSKTESECKRPTFDFLQIYLHTKLPTASPPAKLDGRERQMQW